MINTKKQKLLLARLDDSENFELGAKSGLMGNGPDGQTGGNRKVDGHDNFKEAKEKLEQNAKELYPTSKESSALEKAEAKYKTDEYLATNLRDWLKNRYTNFGAMIQSQDYKQVKSQVDFIESSSKTSKASYFKVVEIEAAKDADKEVSKIRINENKDAQKEILKKQTEEVIKLERLKTSGQIQLEKTKQEPTVLDANETKAYELAKKIGLLSEGFDLEVFNAKVKSGDVGAKKDALELEKALAKDGKTLKVDGKIDQNTIDAARGLIGENADAIGKYEKVLESLKSKTPTAGTPVCTDNSCSIRQ